MSENRPLVTVSADSTRLTVRRTIRASQERLFDGWSPWAPNLPHDRLKVVRSKTVVSAILEPPLCDEVM